MCAKVLNAAMFTMQLYVVGSTRRKIRNSWKRKLERHDWRSSPEGKLLSTYVTCLKFYAVTEEWCGYLRRQLTWLWEASPWAPNATKWSTLRRIFGRNHLLFLCDVLLLACRHCATLTLCSPTVCKHSVRVLLCCSWATRPLHWQVWLALFLLILVVAVIVASFSRVHCHLITPSSLPPLSSKSVTSEQSKALGIQASLWLTLGAFLQQGLFKLLESDQTCVNCKHYIHWLPWHVSAI